MRTDWDLIVIGGGTAGLAAARQARRGGHGVLLVQDGEVGGDCTFTGCIPSKTLIAAAAQGLSSAHAFGRVRATVAQVAAAETADVLRSEGIAVLEGRGRLLGRGGVQVGGARLQAARIVLATGSRPVTPAVPGLAGSAYLTNETVFALAAAPSSLAVVGGGPVGCELAQALARLGTTVTLAEAGPQLLPKEEPEAAEVVATALRDDGVDVRLRAPLREVTPLDGSGRLRLRLGDGSVVEADRVLLATGRAAAVDGLGLDAAGVTLDEAGWVRTDRRLATSARGVWAAGDLTGRLPFTHAADAMGRTAARNATARVGWLPYSTRAVPWVTFTTPEVGRVGLTEEQAARHGGRVAYLPMTELDRAVTAGETRGYLKLIAGPRLVTRDALGGRVLGATVVCSRGGELVHEAALAMQAGMFTGRLAQTTHAYPSWSMAVQLAAGQLFQEVGGRRARPAVA